MPKEFTALLERLRDVFGLEKVEDFTVEIDPRRIQEERLDFYHSQGANKLSFGIQDFDINVQKAINRVQPSEMTEALLTPNVRSKYKSINFDLLVGLPQQTVASISDTVEKVAKMKPNRVSLAYLHYGPKHHLHQRLMLKDGLMPDFYERKELFVTALNGLTSAGYIRTGFEHLALPDDAVAKAIENKSALYNSLGSTAGETTDILAIGRSAYSTIGDYYFQSPYDQGEYHEPLMRGKIPVLRGAHLKIDDAIRRDIIKHLRTYFEVNFDELKQKFNIDFNIYFENEKKELKEFESDGLLVLTKDSIYLTENGKHFSNLIGSIFDRYIGNQSRTRSNIKLEKYKIHNLIKVD